MVRNSDILKGLLGWRQSSLLPFDLDAENLTSSTGRKYEDFSASVDANSIYESWNDFLTTDDIPTQTTKFNQYLKDLVNGSIEQLVNSLFRQIEDLKQNKLLFPYEFDFNHPIDNDGDFVGYEIQIAKTRQFINVINTVDLTFDADGTIDLLLFHSSKIDPVERIDAISVEINNTVTVDLEWYLDEPGGKYYIGYLTNGLVPKALNRRYESAVNMSSFNYIHMQEIKVIGHTLETLFDVNEVTNTSDTYGLNFDISTYCDFTKLVEKNKVKFADAIGMQVAINVLDLYINNVRSNRSQRINTTNSILALEGNNNPQLGLFSQGLRTRLQEEVEALRKLFTKQPIIQKVTLS